MDDNNKFKYGMVFLVIGVLLIVWAWGSWTLRLAPTQSTSYDKPAYADEAGDVLMMEGSAASKKKVDAGAWRFFLFVLLALFLVVLFGSYFLIRAARRYRARTVHVRSPPTNFEDVWASHKLPK